MFILGMLVLSNIWTVEYFLVFRFVSLNARVQFAINDFSCLNPFVFYLFDKSDSF